MAQVLNTDVAGVSEVINAAQINVLGAATKEVLQQKRTVVFDKMKQLEDEIDLAYKYKGAHYGLYSKST